jgi:hypothetical protein
VQFALDRAMISEPGADSLLQPGNAPSFGDPAKATGMTALEFARLHLFGPLGIQNVLWPTDALLNHGWRYPPPSHDTAKIGPLAPPRSMAGAADRPGVGDSSIRTQIRTGRTTITATAGGSRATTGSSYIGRGGQRIQVWPPINAILTMIGGASTSTISSP